MLAVRLTLLAVAALLLWACFSLEERDHYREGFADGRRRWPYTPPGLSVLFVAVVVGLVLGYFVGQVLESPWPIAAALAVCAVPTWRHWREQQERIPD